MGDTHNNLLSSTFDALLAFPNARFTMLFDKQKIKWKEGDTCTFESLSEKVNTNCKCTHTNKQWNSVDPKDARTIALVVKAQKLEGKKYNFHIFPWRKINVGGMVSKDIEPWWWFPNHDGADFKGLCDRHEPENHRNIKNKKINPIKPIEPEKPSGAPVNKISLLSKNMKAALATVGMLTNDQVKSIVKETETSLLEDFLKVPKDVKLACF